MLVELAGSLTSGVRLVVHHLDRTFDEESSEDKGRFVIKSGVDLRLDEQRRLHNGLPDLLHRVMQEEIERLPDAISVCTMIYVPRLGYLLRPEPWRQGLDKMSHGRPRRSLGGVP